MANQAHRVMDQLSLSYSDIFLGEGDRQLSVQSSVTEVYARTKRNVLLREWANVG